MQEKPAQALGSVIETAALEIFWNSSIDQPNLPRTGVGVGFGNGRFALAQRFHLGSGKRNSGLEDLTDLVIEPRPAIVGDDAGIAVRFCRHGTINSVAPSTGREFH